MLKWKLQYFGHLMRRADSLEKTLRLGKIEGEGEKKEEATKTLNPLRNKDQREVKAPWKIRKYVDYLR